MTGGQRISCDICGKSASQPHWPMHASDKRSGVVLCGSAHCEFRHKAMPPALKCAVCSRPLLLTQLAQRQCDDAECSQEMRRRNPETVEAEAVQQAFSTASEHRRRSAAARGLSQEEAETFPPTLIPKNTARVSKLPAARRRKFESFLRTALADAQRMLHEEDAPSEMAYERAPLDRHDCTPSEKDALSQLLMTGCIQCRGRCCMGGGEHAFHSADTLRLYLHRHPANDIEALVANYMGHIGERTMTNGCVFQGERGCTLASEMRSPTCHQYFCRGLRAVYDQYEVGEPVRAYYVQIQKRKITTTAFVDIDINRPHQ